MFPKHKEEPHAETIMLLTYTSSLDVARDIHHSSDPGTSDDE